MDYKYLEIAKKIEEQISSSIIKVGEKLPSLRMMSKSFAVSIGTVEQAYGYLEDKELIHSKNRSGYYVLAPLDFSIDSPMESNFESKPQEIKILDLSMQVMSKTQENTPYPLGSAIPDIESRAVKQIHSALRRHAVYIPNHYEGPQGNLDLRRQISKRSLLGGKIYKPEEIIITSGCQESLTIALQVCTGPGDLVAIESPGYYGLLQSLEVLGRRVLEIPVCPDRGMDLDQLESLLQRHNVSALVLNPAYSNPTGHCYSDEHKSQICHIVSRLDIPLIEDDVFAELGHGFNRPKTIFSFDHQGRVLLCSSFSKSLSQDLRVGWLVPGRYFLKARDYKYASTLGTSSLQQWALADFLQGKQYERHLQSVSINYGKKLCLFKEMIKELFPKETKMTQPKGGYLSWIKLPGSLDSLRLYDLALQQGISITPGRLFSVSPRFNNYIRLNFASLPPEKMHRALTELACLISQAS